LTATLFALEISVQPVTFETSLPINKNIKTGIFPLPETYKKEQF
jgi:hypothetical protein